jgi:hypothetical protein
VMVNWSMLELEGACPLLQTLIQFISFQWHAPQGLPIRYPVNNNQGRRMGSMCTAQCFIPQLIQQKVSDVASLSNKGAPCIPTPSVQYFHVQHPSPPPSPQTEPHNRGA